MYRIAICEDEDETAQHIAELCRTVMCGLGEPTEVSRYASADMLDQVLTEHRGRFDLILLDIQMEGTSGLQFAKQLFERGEETPVIFITANGEYALEAYDAHPLHYLLKPVTRESLEPALRLAWERYRARSIGISVGKKTILLPVADICCLESRNHGTVATLEQEEQNFPVPLSKIEPQLPPKMFAHCHKSYLVNLGWVEEVGRKEVRLRNGKLLPISRSCAQAFQSALIHYFSGR